MYPGRLRYRLVVLYLLTFKPAIRLLASHTNWPYFA